MSVDGSLIEKESPPQYVTQRGVVSSTEIQELRAEFRAIVTSMEKWFTRQDEKISKVIDDFNDMKASIKFISDGYEDIKTKTEAVSQRCNAEVGNLPEKRGENLVAFLENIADLVKMSISQQDIVAIHRVRQANSGSSHPKNVVVKFSSRILRDSFLAAVRIRKGITTEQLGISGWPGRRRSSIAFGSSGLSMIPYSPGSMRSQRCSPCAPRRIWGSSQCRISDAPLRA
ncbi:Zinc finger DNA binding protein, partial [Operophtera brumata]